MSGEVGEIGLPVFFVLMQHILFAHAPWLIEKYGSLNMWSAQGMEKSHYATRCAYFKSTHHGSGVFCSNALHEMFEWFYHGIIGSSLEREKALLMQLGRAINDVNKNKKQVS